MKQLLYIGFAALFCSGCSPTGGKEASGNAGKEAVIFADYRELPDPAAAAGAAAWDGLKERLYFSFGSPDRRYAKSEVPLTGSPRTEWSGTAWKGERVNLQLLLWATADLGGLEVKAGDLEGGQGEKIPASAVKTSFVRYVMTDEFGNGCGKRQPADFDSSLVADVIDVIPRMDMAARTVRPVWVQIAVPTGAAPGEYRGTLSVQGEDGVSAPPLEIRLSVADRSLPPPSEWTFHLDLWQNPFSVSRVNGVENWSPEHLKAMEPGMRMLAGAGQKVVTASIIHDPWNSQTYDVYDSMIRWIKKKDGSWEYDYSVFDKWVEYMSGLGIGGQINCYSMVPWNLKFYYYDENYGKDTLITAAPGTEEYDAHWRPMLEDFAKHLKEKGWFGKTAIAMDERPLEAMLAVIKLVKSVDKDLKLALAGNYHSEIAMDIDDYCIASAQVMGSDTLQLRKETGRTTTYYTCCVEPYPNTFTFSPPAESAWLAWHAAAKGYDGYLRWAYNCWVKDPLRDTRFRAWPAGDTYLVYPGGRSSIRFEQMIDGIEDYVKIGIIRQRLQEANDRAGLQRLNTLLEPFADPGRLSSVPAADMLGQARKALQEF